MIYTLQRRTNSGDSARLGLETTTAAAAGGGPLRDQFNSRGISLKRLSKALCASVRD